MTTTKTTEQLLRHLSELRRDYHFSVDIYHEDFSDEYVVKIHNLADTEDGDTVFHFRGQWISDLLLDAVNFIVNRKKNRQ